MTPWLMGLGTRQWMEKHPVLLECIASSRGWQTLRNHMGDLPKDSNVPENPAAKGNTPIHFKGQNHHAFPSNQFPDWKNKSPEQRQTISIGNKRQFENSLHTIRNEMAVLFLFARGGFRHQCFGPLGARGYLALRVHLKILTWKNY